MANLVQSGRAAIPFRSSAANRFASVVFAFFLFGATGYLAAVYLTMPAIDLVKHLPDDTFYYFETAQNMAAGQGMTFDGIHPTNGFQPLWLLLLVPLYTVLHGSPEFMARASLLFGLPFLLLGGACLFSYVRKAWDGRTALLIGLVYILLVFFTAANGMESALLILCLVFVAVWGLKVHTAGRRSGWNAFVLGALLGLVMLSRLDHVFLAVLVFAAMFMIVLWRPNKGRNLLSLIIAGLGSLAVVLPYLAYNIAVFGAAMPLSGQLKSSFPHISFTLATLDRVGMPRLVIAVAGLGYAIWLLLRLRQAAGWSPERRFHRLLTAVLGMAVLLHFVHTCLFMRWGVYGWHFIAYPLFLTLLLTEPAAWLLAAAQKRRLSWVYPLAAVMLVVVTVVNVERVARFELGCNGASYDAAVWARTHTAPDAIFCQRDTGVFGFFSERRTINLDGLVNTMEYQDVLRDQRLREYLAAENVSYLVFYAYGQYRDVQGDYGALRVRYVSQAYGRQSDELVLPQYAEVYRSAPFADGNPGILCIWDYKACIADSTASPKA